MYVRKSQVVWDNRLSLSFSCKVNVLHLSHIESNQPVRVIVSLQSRDLEAVWYVAAQLTGNWRT